MDIEYIDIYKGDLNIIYRNIYNNLNIYYKDTIKNNGEFYYKDKDNNFIYIGNYNDINIDIIKEYSIKSKVFLNESKEYVYDDSIRNTYELNINNLYIYNHNIMNNINLDNIKLKFINSKDIDIVPHRMFLYTQGSFFNNHMDYNDNENFIGKIIYCICDKYEGGELVLIDKNKEKEYSIRLNNNEWCFFYNYCEHRVNEIISGNRIVLVYNVYTKNNKLDFNNIIDKTETEKIDILCDKINEYNLDKDQIILLELYHKYDNIKDIDNLQDYDNIIYNRLKDNLNKYINICYIDIEHSVPPIWDDDKEYIDKKVDIDKISIYDNIDRSRYMIHILNRTDLEECFCFSEGDIMLSFKDNVNKDWFYYKTNYCGDTGAWIEHLYRKYFILICNKNDLNT